MESGGLPAITDGKLDVEGVEVVVIKGGWDFFLKGVIDFALVEVGEWSQARTGVHYSEMYAELAHSGFEQVYVF